MVDADSLAFTASFATADLRPAPAGQCPNCGVMAEVFLSEEPDACTDWRQNPNHDDLKTIWLGVVAESGLHDFVHTFSVIGCPGCIPIPGGDSAGTYGINGSFIASVHVAHGANYTSPEGTGPNDPSFRYATGTITISSYVELVSIAGSFSGTFGDGSVVSGNFDAKFCVGAQCSM